jgi:hypothetical protein
MFDIKLLVLCAAVFLDASTVTVTAQLEPAPDDVWSELQAREQLAPGAVDDARNFPIDPAVNPFAEQEMEPLVQEARHRSDHSADHSRSRDRDDSDWRNGRWKGGRRPGPGRGQPRQRDLGDEMTENLAVGDPALDQQEEQLVQEARHRGDHSADHSRSRDHDDSDWRNGRWRGGVNGGRRPGPSGGRRPVPGRGQPRQRYLTGETAENLAQNSEAQQLFDEPDDKIVPVDDDVQSRAA